MNEKHVRGKSRRQFLKSTLVAAVVPVVVQASALGGHNKVAPSDRITLGIIGCGKMANDYQIPELLRFDDVQVLAVCDVDRPRRAHALHRVWTKHTPKRIPLAVAGHTTTFAG